MCHLVAPDAKSIQAESAQARRVVRRNSTGVMCGSAHRLRGSATGPHARRAAAAQCFRGYTSRGDLFAVLACPMLT